MIGILKALGMKNISLIKIFVSHGGILLFYGFLAGNSLAILIIHLIYGKLLHYGVLSWVEFSFS